MIGLLSVGTQIHAKGLQRTGLNGKTTGLLSEVHLV